MTRQERALQEKELYEQGVSVVAIAEQYGISTTAVQKDMKLLGVPSRRKSKEEANRNTIIAMYKEGASFKAIGEAVGYSGTTVRAMLVEWGYYDVFIPTEVKNDENTIYAKERPKAVPCEVYGKKYLDVTEVFCPN